MIFRKTKSTPDIEALARHLQRQLIEHPELGDRRVGVKGYGPATSAPNYDQLEQRFDENEASHREFLLGCSKADLVRELLEVERAFRAELRGAAAARVKIIALEAATCSEANCRGTGRAESKLRTSEHYRAAADARCRELEQQLAAVLAAQPAPRPATVDVGALPAGQVGGR